MSLESKLRGFESDAEHGERLRDEVGKQLTSLNSDLTSDISEMIRTMFTSDKQFERALKEKLDEASSSKKEFVLTQGGQKFKVSDIDPKRIMQERELTGFEQEKLKKVKVTLDDIETGAKAALGVIRRERILLKEFSREAKSIAQELRSDLKKGKGEKDVNEAESMISDFESRADRISVVENDLSNTQTEAAKLMETAKQAKNVIDSVAKRADLDDILTAAAGGFGVSAAIAALLGSMGAAGILALPALVAFALSRVVKIVKQVAGKD